MPTKAYSYLRFSTPEQARGDSFRRQYQMAKEYAAHNGLELDESLTFHDLGVSAFRGKNAEVGMLAEFRQATNAGLVEPGSFLLVENLDRISRDAVWRAVNILVEICAEDVTVVTLNDGRRYTRETLQNDPITLLITILGFMRGNEESATKARRLKAVWEAKRANALVKPVTSQVPAWLKLDKSRAVFELVEERAVIIQRIFRLTLDGMGKHTVAETLNREAVPVFGRGKYWHPTYISKVLSNPAAIGTYTPHTTEFIDGRKVRNKLKPIENYFPVVVDAETYLRVQALRQSSNPAVRGRHVGQECRNLFSSLGVCPLCGATMTRVNKGQGNGRNYLVCSKAKVGAGCRYKAVYYDQMETAFVEQHHALLRTLPAGNRVSETLDIELEDIEFNISGLEDTLERLLDGFKERNSSALARRIRTVEDLLEAEKRKRDELQVFHAASRGGLVDSKVADLRSTLMAQPLNRTKVNTILRQLLDKVVIDYTWGQLMFHWKHGGVTEINFAWPENAGESSGLMIRQAPDTKTFTQS